MAPTSSNRKSDTTPAGSPTSAAPDNAAALSSAESIPSANPFAANAARVPLFSADSSGTVELPKTAPGDLPPTTPMPVTQADTHAMTVSDAVPTMPIPAVTSSITSTSVSSAKSTATRTTENPKATSDVPYTEEFRADASAESTIPIPGKAVRLAVDGDDNSGDNSSTRSDTVHTTAHNSGDINNTATTVHTTAQVEERKESEESEQSEEPSPWKTGVSALTVTFGLILLMLSSVGFLAVYRFPDPVFSAHSGSIDAILLAALLAVAGLALIAGVLIRAFRHVRS